MRKSAALIAGANGTAGYRSDERIAIVGAGPSGLTIAAELKKRGYANVVVFEQGEQLGGKVATVWRNGLPAELGAICIFATYSNVRALIREHELHLDAYPVSIDVETKDGATRAFWQSCRSKFGSRREAFSQLWRMMRLAKEVDRHPGLGHVSNDFAESFEQFACRHEFSLAADAFRPCAIGCGYGYYETVPAAYFLKHVPRGVGPFLQQFVAQAIGRSRSPGMMLREGYQTLWQRVANRAKLDVRLAVKVDRIVRMPNTKQSVLELQNGASEIFDYVFVTSPASSWPKMFEPSISKERRLEQIKSITYRSVIADVNGLPSEKSWFLEKHCHPLAGPGVIFVVNLSARTNLYTLYQILPEGCSNAQINFMMHADLAALGATQIKIEAQRDWPHYFPHVSPADFAAGFHRNLEEHQGRHGIFLAGSLLNGETVEHAIEYGKDLVRRFFPQKTSDLLSRRR